MLINAYEVSLMHLLWWKVMCGATIKVRWPYGEVLVGPNSRYWDGTTGELRQIVISADPNDHYRDWLEDNVGKQGFDWEWALAGDDLTKETLTIRFRRGKKKYAILASLLWS